MRPGGGQEAPAGGTGHGLVGMRERATLFDGSPGRRAAPGRWVSGRRHAAIHPGAGAVIRVLVADDQALVRGGLRASCSMASPTSTVVGEAADGAEAVALAAHDRPDVVLMDIRMPEIDGIEATRQIAAATAPGSTRVLVLTTFDLDEYVYDALRAGASGFLLKDTPPAELLAGGPRRGRGEALLSPASPAG